MNELMKAMEAIRGRLDAYRRADLKETPTRTIIVDPLLQALGWDVRDPEEVELEYTTVDGKTVDYALKLNRKPVLLVEAKPLNNPLNDVKATTQVVGYAANAGIVWCILTNGVNWKVYKSVERCEAPEKLMYEVALDPAQSEGISVEQLARQMWQFSREAMARGTLDELGEKTFTDEKVRKALDSLMKDPPLALLRLVRKGVGEETLKPGRIRESLGRVWSSFGMATTAATSPQSPAPAPLPGRAEARRPPRPTGGKYTEAHHTDGKPRGVLELYRALDRLCMALSPGMVLKSFKAKVINYAIGRKIFCAVHPLQGGLRIWVRLKYNRLVDPPSFARDVANVGHWGSGDVELDLDTMDQLQEAAGLIRQSFEAVA